MNNVLAALPVHERAMPFLAHLEELRKRIIFSILSILGGFFCVGPTPTGCSVLCSNRLSKRYATMASAGAWCT